MASHTQESAKAASHSVIITLAFINHFRCRRESWAKNRYWRWNGVAEVFSVSAEDCGYTELTPFIWFGARG